MTEFNVGDIVQLKSGGPSMTVTEVGEAKSGSATVTCHWFASEMIQHASFPAKALQVFTKLERRKRPTDVY